MVTEPGRAVRFGDPWGEGGGLGDGWRGSEGAPGVLGGGPEGVGEGWGGLEAFVGQSRVPWGVWRGFGRGAEDVWGSLRGCRGGLGDLGGPGRVLGNPGRGL